MKKQKEAGEDAIKNLYEIAEAGYFYIVVGKKKFGPYMCEGAEVNAEYIMHRMSVNLKLIAVREV